MGTDIELVRASSRDIPALIATEQQAEEGTYTPILTENGWEEELRTHVVYLLMVGNDIAGTLSYTFREPGRLYFSSIIVRKEFRGQGIGRKAVMRAILEHPEVKRFDVAAHPHNLRALKLYHELGFKTETRIEDYGDGSARLLLSLHR